MKRFVIILTALLVVGCITAGSLSGMMWGATQDPPIVASYKAENPDETYSEIPYAATYEADKNESGSDNTPQTQQDGSGGAPESAENPEKKANKYEGRYIMTAETTKLIGYGGKRTYFLTINSGDTFEIITDYEVDGEWEYERHVGEYKVVSKNKIDMKLTEYSSSIPEKDEKNKYKYKDAETVRVTIKDDKLTCKQGKKKYEFEKLPG